MIQQGYPFENNWYYVTEPRAITSLINNGVNINALIPFWFGVTEQAGLIDQSDTNTLSITRQIGLPVIPIVHNFASPEYGPLIHRLLTNQYLRRSLVLNIYNMLISYGFPGVNIDFEFVPPEDRQFMTTFMTELSQVLKPAGLLVTISVPPELRDDPAHPFSGAFSYPDLAENSDQIYVLAYDEHVSQPGPIASIGFVRQVLSYALSVIPREKIRLGMAVYGRDWSENTILPMELSFNEAVNRAAQFGATIRFDEEAQEPTYTYTENGTQHIVWFENIKSFMTKIHLVLQNGIPGIGVWRLGLEDVRIWDFCYQSLIAP
ncbi:MAG: glycoside hydrolase [Firmicutes bacterium]|nr:glycoside hydrolase [Bacillota bacterium]